MILYHVTFAKHIDRIKRVGIKPHQPRLWKRAGDLSPYGDGSIYVFEDRHDAIRWAGKMDWEWHQATGTGKIAVLCIQSKPEGWVEDLSDPLSRAGSKGRWLKGYEAIHPEQIVGHELVTREKLKSVIC